MFLSKAPINQTGIAIDYAAAPAIKRRFSAPLCCDYEKGKSRRSNPDFVNEIASPLSTYLLCLIMIIFLFFPLVSTCVAETCPTLSEIKSANPNSIEINNWYALDIDNANRLTLSAFANAVEFELAEWMIDAPEGEAHCYYGVNAYLAKHNLKPAFIKDYWKKIGNDAVYQCNSTVNTCLFLS